MEKQIKGFVLVMTSAGKQFRFNSGKELKGKTYTMHRHALDGMVTLVDNVTGAKNGVKAPVRHLNREKVGIGSLLILDKVEAL